MSEYDPEEKIWRGPRKTKILNLSAPFGQILIELMEKNPKKILQVHDDCNLYLTADEIRRKSIRVANALTLMGFKQGDMAMIASKNQPELAPVFFGCFLIGVPINPIDVNFSKGKMG